MHRTVPLPRLSLVAAALLPLAGGCRATPAPEENRAMASRPQRIVCIGDSITDGYTYGQILMQALGEAGRPVPAVICAGVASDTAPQMLARLERDVLPFAPDLVTFSAGTNDSLRGISPADYEAAVRALAARLRALGIPLILQTPCAINPAPGGTPAEQAARQAKAAAAEALGDQYEESLRRLAAEHGYPVAETRRLQQAARAAGQEIMAGDGIHPNYLGQGLMARALLDAMGLAAVPLPAEFQPRLFPGVVREWRVRPAPEGKPLDLAGAAALEPDDAWTLYRLPDPVPAPPVSAADWAEQCRRNGFAWRLEAALGKSPLYQAVADLDEPAARRAWINTGAGIASVWLNGVRLHEQAGWTGYHAGKERLPVDLRPGRNRLVLEIKGSQFFLSVTDRLAWEEVYRLEFVR
jgi:lysophospholipase L1-like esterase